MKISCVIPPIFKDFRVSVLPLYPPGEQGGAYGTHMPPTPPTQRVLGTQNLRHAPDSARPRTQAYKAELTWRECPEPKGHVPSPIQGGRKENNEPRGQANGQTN